MSGMFVLTDLSVLKRVIFSLALGELRRMIRRTLTKTSYITLTNLATYVRTSTSFLWKRGARETYRPTKSHGRKRSIAESSPEPLFSGAVAPNRT